MLLSEPAQGFFYWWDPRTGRERRGPKIDDIGWRDIALAPGGEWLLVVVADTKGTTLRRYRLDRTGAVIDREDRPFPGVGSGTGAVADDGHLLYSLRTWAGELALARPPRRHALVIRRRDRPWACPLAPIPAMLGV